MRCSIHSKIGDSADAAGTNNPSYFACSRLVPVRSEPLTRDISVKQNSQSTTPTRCAQQARSCVSITLVISSLCVDTQTVRVKAGLACCPHCCLKFSPSDLRGLCPPPCSPFRTPYLLELMNMLRNGKLFQTLVVKSTCGAHLRALSLPGRELVAHSLARAKFVTI